MEGKSLYKLKSGEEKWMTKREYNSYINRLKSLKTIYDDYVNAGFIDPNLDEIGQIQQVVDLGVDLMFIIGKTADEITITGYNRIKKEINKKIIKKDFTDIVNFVAKTKDNDNISDEKLTEKLFKEIEEVLFRVNFKRNFYNNYITFKDIVSTDDTEKVLFPKLSSKDNKTFKKIVNSCAKARRYLNENLWPQYREYAALAEYISKGDLTYDRYKKLVDYKYYTGDEDKRFQGQDKRWEVMAKNFLSVYKLCKDYGYDDYFRTVEITINNYMNDMIEENKNIG